MLYEKNSFTHNCIETKRTPQSMAYLSVDFFAAQV